MSSIKDSVYSLMSSRVWIIARRKELPADFSQNRILRNSNEADAVVFAAAARDWCEHGTFFSDLLFPVSAKQVVLVCVKFLL